MNDKKLEEECKSCVNEESFSKTTTSESRILIKQCETQSDKEKSNVKSKQEKTNNTESNEIKKEQASGLTDNLIAIQQYATDKINNLINNDKTKTEETNDNNKNFIFVEHLISIDSGYKNDKIESIVEEKSNATTILVTTNHKETIESRNKNNVTKVENSSLDETIKESNEINQESTFEDKLAETQSEKYKSNCEVELLNEEGTKSDRVKLENFKLDKTNENNKCRDRNKLQELIKEFNIDAEDFDKIEHGDNLVVKGNVKIHKNIEKDERDDNESNRDEIVNVSLSFNTQTNAFEVNQDKINKEGSADSEILNTDTKRSQETDDFKVEDDFLLAPLEAINIVETKNKIEDSDTSAPVLCINVTFNTNTNKYELQQAQTNEILDNESQEDMSTTKDNTQDSLSTINTNAEEDESIDQEMNTKGDMDEANKKTEESQENDTDKFLKPSRSCTPSVAGTDDELSLKALINWYSDDVGKQIDENSKPVVFPPPSLEDTHLDFPEPQELRYHCGDCNKKFTIQYDIATHKCDKKCNDFTSFNRTLRKRRLSCPDPFESEIKDSEPKSEDKGIGTKAIRLGVDLGPYSCPLCKKTLSRRSGLKIHLRRHNKEMPYQCEYCNKKFVVLYDLDRHMLTHLGEKRYRLMCEVCSRPFMSKDGLIQHKRIAHCGYAAYICDICQKPFNQEYRLWKHKKAEHEYGSVVKQSNVIDESLELLEEIEKPPGEKTTAMSLESNIEIDDSNIDKDPIDLIGLNPMDIQLYELNTTDGLSEALYIVEDKQPKSMDINQKISTELELVGLNESIINEAYDLADLANSNVANESIKVIENEMELSDNNSVSLIVEQSSGVTGFKEKGNSIVPIASVATEVIEVELVDMEDMTVIDDLTNSEIVNKTKNILPIKQKGIERSNIKKRDIADVSIGETISIKLDSTDNSADDLSGFKLDLNESNELTNAVLPLGEIEKPCVLNGKIELVDVIPLSNVDDTVEILDLNQSGVLLL